MKDRVLLIGSYPPPYGGCSVHVQRLKHALEQDYSVEVVDLYGGRQVKDDSGVIRCGPRNPLNALRAIWTVGTRHAPIVHFHVAGMESFLFASYPLLAAMPRHTSTILTIHSGSFVSRFAKGPAWRRSILLNVLRRIDRIVTVNEDQRNFVESIGIPASHLRVVPAFLPPVACASQRTREVLRGLGDYDRLVIASGYGQRHYGFGVILDALGALRATGKNVRAVFCTYNSYDERYMAELEHRMAAEGTGTIVRDLGPEEFVWLLQQCDTYVRATDRDGDAVAIREALHAGKAVVASDCVTRPSDVQLFNTDDARSLELALRATDDDAPSVSGVDATDGLTALREMYREALSR